MDYVKPLEGVGSDTLVMAAPCCTKASPCRWHEQAYVSAGYHTCPKCGGICDCPLEPSGPDNLETCWCYNGCGNGDDEVLE